MPGSRTGPTTAVIGAGISGLTTGKMLADYGVPYTCFEASDRVGGNWAFGNPNGHSSAYQSLHIDTSKHQLSFKDFPLPAQYPDFPHHTLIKEYLDSNADAFRSQPTEQPLRRRPEIERLLGRHTGRTEGAARPAARGAGVADDGPVGGRLAPDGSACGGLGSRAGRRAHAATSVMACDRAISA